MGLPAASVCSMCVCSRLVTGCVFVAGINKRAVLKSFKMSSTCPSEHQHPTKMVKESGKEGEEGDVEGEKGEGRERMS